MRQHAQQACRIVLMYRTGMMVCHAGSIRLNAMRTTFVLFGR
jgi:hypothetical protein